MTTTDRRATGGRAPARPPRFLLTAAGACACFVGALGFLTMQMSAGKDPALGPGTPATPPPAPVRRVLVRHVVETRVVPAEVIVRRRVAHAVTEAAAAAPLPVRQVVRVSRPEPAPTPVPKAKPAPKPAAPKPAAAAPAPEPAAPTTHQS